MINLVCSKTSDTAPFWSKSLSAITKQFNRVSKDAICSGMDELRRKKLIEVKYDELVADKHEERAPKMYKILALYDPKKLESKLKEIKDKYGKEVYNQARKYAGIVFEENNPEVIEDIILKIRQYGQDKVERAFEIINSKNPDNPKKTYSYTVGIMERLVATKSK